MNHTSGGNLVLIDRVLVADIVFVLVSEEHGI